MGVVQVISPCVRCRQLFSYNPHRVPSMRVDGVRQPICSACVEAVNPRRVANGLAPIVPLPGTYDPLDEHEL